MKMQGCAEWSGVLGMRSKWFWIDEPSMTMGGVYVFNNMQSVEDYKKTPLFKSMWTTPIVDAKTIVIEVHENLPGGEETHMMEKWPVSVGRMPVCQGDLKNAWMLMPQFRFDFTTNPDVPDAEAMKKMMGNGGTAYWKDIKGLRTKYFTFRPDDNNKGYGFYIFTNRADLDEYLKGPVWGMMS